MKDVVRVVSTSDSFRVLATFRARKALQAARVPVMGRVLRLMQTAVYGLELGKDIQLGEGVYFVHTVGTVIGGTAKIGDRVRFMGNNTVGTASDNGYPVVGNDVLIGCGARILGPIRVGDGAVIGANAVVIHDVPPGATVVGIPAKVVQPKGAA